MYDTEKIKIINHIQNKVDIEDLSRILGSFDMAETAYSNKKQPNLYLDFDHNIRMFWILADELSINDADLMIACMLYGINYYDPSITPEIIAYNFGEYVAYLISESEENSSPQALNFISTRDNYIILRLIHYLDNLRNQQFNPINELINLLAEIKQKFAKVLETNQNPLITELIAKINIESNKFFT